MGAWEQSADHPGGQHGGPATAPPPPTTTVLHENAERSISRASETVRSPSRRTGPLLVGAGQRGRAHGSPPRRGAAGCPPHRAFFVLHTLPLAFPLF